MARPKIDDTAILRAALAGLQHQHREYTEKIAEIRKQLGIRGGTSIDGVVAQPPARKRRKMSAAAKRAIGNATRARWAAYRKAKAGK